MRKLLSILLPIAAIAPIAVVLLYVYAFGRDTLSHLPSDWAEFGEYVGGTLGAVYGFLAFIGVLVTIRIQQSQSNLDELQRLLASEAERIDAMLDSDPRQPDPIFRELRGDAGNTVRSLLELGAAVAISRDSKRVPDERRREELIQNSTRQIKLETRILNGEFEQFAELLVQYLSAGGNRVVVAHYETKYALPVGFLDVTGLLRSDSLRGYFRDSKIAVETCRQWGIPAELAYAGRSPAL